MKSIGYIESVKSSSLVDIIHIDEVLDAKSWELLSNRADKNWSLVDCSSFVVMRENEILEALTTDHHFEQAGFVRMLKKIIYKLVLHITAAKPSMHRANG